MSEKDREMDYALADLIIEIPHEFTIGRKQLRLYPVTLAKSLLLRRYIDALDIDTNLLLTNPYLEAMRLVRQKRDLCATVLAIHTSPNNYRDLYNSQAMKNRRNILRKADPDDMAALLILVLTDKTGDLMNHFGITDERERMAAVAKNRKPTGVLAFGGKTIFGSFIAPLHEMGYSDSEILYERSYAYLRMLLADKVAEMYLSEEEHKNLPASLGGKMVDGNDPASLSKLKERLSGKGVKFNS